MKEFRETTVEVALPRRFFGLASSKGSPAQHISKKSGSSSSDSAIARVCFDTSCSTLGFITGSSETLAASAGRSVGTESSALGLPDDSSATGSQSVVEADIKSGFSSSSSVSTDIARAFVALRLATVFPVHMQHPIRTMRLSLKGSKEVVKIANQRYVTADPMEHQPPVRMLHWFWEAASKLW